MVLPTVGIPRMQDFSSLERIFRIGWIVSVVGVIFGVLTNSPPSSLRGKVGNFFPR